MFFNADLGGRGQPVGDREQPRLPVAMPATIDGNGFLAEVDGGEMGAGGDASFPQDGAANSRPSQGACCRTESSF